MSPFSTAFWDKSYPVLPSLSLITFSWPFFRSLPVARPASLFLMSNMPAPSAPPMPAWSICFAIDRDSPLIQLSPADFIASWRAPTSAAHGLSLDMPATCRNWSTGLAALRFAISNPFTS